MGRGEEGRDEGREVAHGEEAEYWVLIYCILHD
jgi:hypothetical protein